MAFQKYLKTLFISPNKLHTCVETRNIQYPSCRQYMYQQKVSSMLWEIESKDLLIVDNGMANMTEMTVSTACNKLLLF